MQAQQDLSELQFVNLHVVDKNYHELHSQLLHKHEDVLELFYIMQGDGQYIVGGKEYIIRPGNLVICNEDILHGEAPFCSREMESYCCVVRGLHLPELGERFHISHYYPSRLFKAETGLSPMKYVMYRKIGESQNLLMNTELPIGTISDRMGFLDNCHFSTTFKKYIGLTPTQYRQHFQKSPYNRLISHS